MKLCECGCLQPTQLAKAHDKRDGVVKGQPMRFINHHHTRARIITMEYLLARIEIVTESGCWIWMGEITKSHGYGVVNGHFGDGKRRQYAHRVFYEVFNGPIPDGLTLDHLCRVRPCCNPYHLESVTIGVNVLRGNSMSGIHSRKTHCIRGHELSGDNLGRISSRPNARRCIICSKIRAEKSEMNRRQKWLLAHAAKTS